MKTSVILLFIAVVSIYACGPKADPIQCFQDSIKNLDGVIYTGHITLCNAQGSNLIYEPGICSVDVRIDSIIFTLSSTNPNYNYFYSDTLTSQCGVLEGIKRVFELHDFSSSFEMGTINETDNEILLIINDSQCPSSSFFEGIP